ncbi:hypothetical protein ACFQ3N_09085 [Virgibacillus byunsanensis]|uniref:Uncharacterized protein n=1 Tax=Virgibacillus byunsanensis TaxID=570945 RepID=A0ABW3LNQ4_9BACI
MPTESEVFCRSGDTALDTEKANPQKSYVAVYINYEDEKATTHTKTA